MADDLNNPYLDEIQKAHATLSPGAQQVVSQAMPFLAPRLPGGAESPGPPPAPRPIAAPAPRPQLVHTPTANEAELARITAPPIPSGPLEHTRANTGTPGVNQIKSPLVRTLGKIGDVAVGSLFPRLAMNIPGTTAHHEALVRDREGLANEETKRGREQAETAEAGARAEQLGNPKFAAENVHVLPDGTVVGVGTDPKTGQASAHVLYKGDPKIQGKVIERNVNGTVHNVLINEGTGEDIKDLGEGKPVAPKEAETPLSDEEISTANAQLARRYGVNHGKEPVPADLILNKGATRADLANVEKMLTGTEGAEATKTAREQAAEDRKLNREIAAGSREQKQDTATRQAAIKAYEPGVESGERFNVMTKNYEDAVKNHDQQAMLSLLANHLGMTMGLQKGARLTRDIIHEAEQSRPWLQGLKAKFDKDGYLAGVTLTPEQMRQMVTLGRERFAEDITKGRNQAKYIGVTDDGPARTANKSTMRFYMGIAGGDVTKAKQMAQQDGWTVE